MAEGEGPRGQFAPLLIEQGVGGGQTHLFVPSKISTLNVVASVPHKPTAGRAQFGPFFDKCNKI